MPHPSHQTGNYSDTASWVQEFGRTLSPISSMTLPNGGAIVNDVGWDPDSEIWSRVWGEIMDGVTLGFDVQPSDLGRSGSVHLENFSLVIMRVRGRPVRDARHRRAFRLPTYGHYVVERALRPGHSTYGHKKHTRRRKIVKCDTRRRFEFGNITDQLTWRR